MLPSAGLVKALIINMQNKMKKFRNIFMAVLAASLLSCSGNVDDSSLPVLEASDTEIDLATETETVFTVRYNGVDVTEDAEIVSVSGTEDFDGKVFRPQSTGSETFYASYNGKESAQVTVNVVNSRPQVESKYDRHVCVMEFTGAWCINCPDGYDKMIGVMSKPSMSRYKENIHLCAFHSDLEGKDDMAIPQTQDLFAMFDGLAYPSFVTDMREAGILTADGISLFQPSIMASFGDHAAHCGVSVSSVMSGSQAEISVKVQSELTSQYRVIVLVVQDAVKGWQKTNLYPEGDDNYIHKHVVRKVVTSYSGTFAGEKITEDGIIASGAEASGSWTVVVDESWNLDDTEIYALVQDMNGYINNMNVCAIDGGDSGYDLK
ncbi:MAG: Omp28-related outer membrane protein [Bacteroidales bacterium]|nr:Omp28-related outer membrane protein [Bacteroidales bacterium]